MTFVGFVVAFVLGLMLAEQRVSAANERTLKAKGAICPPGDVFGLMRWLYPAAFVAMGAEGAWHAWQPALGPVANGPSFVVSGVVLFGASKALKYWAIRTLAERWTFKVYVEPGRKLETSGPYAYVGHPNYIAVVGELVGTAMMVQAPVTGVVAVAVFGAALVARIRFEERVMAEALRMSPADSGSVTSKR